MRSSYLRKLNITIALVLLLIAGSVPAPAREPVKARNAMVASQHRLASLIGSEVMKKGGNAVDAAIAVGLALAVVYPEAGNIGGGGFMVIRTAGGKNASIDYRERAPKAASRDMYLDSGGDPIRGEGGSIVGYRAAGVPGTVAGFELAFRKYGSGIVSWADLVEPARKLAAEGFILSKRQADMFRSYRDSLGQYEDSKRIFLNRGRPFEAGDRLVQKDLSATLARIRDEGAKGFYEGETARLIASDMKDNGGLITLEDLKDYRAVEREPVEGIYRGNRIISMGPPSSGGIVLLQVLNILERHDLRTPGFNSAQKNHLLVEAMRRAFADRAELMGDPDHGNVPVEKLIDKSYAYQRGKTILKDKATPSTQIGAGVPLTAESTDTTHYSVVDKDGNVVANTYTINNIFGNAVTAKGTGVLLNDEMDDFALQPGKPNLFGLVQGEINSIEPGKRPLSSMTPTIVLRPDGSFWFAVGARGGPRIISALIQTIINVIDHEMGIQRAVYAARIHHQWLPDQIYYEPFGISPDTRRIMEGFGHRFADSPGNIASATAVAADEKGFRIGVIDVRSDGEAVGH